MPRGWVVVRRRRGSAWATPADRLVAMRGAGRDLAARGQSGGWAAVELTLARTYLRGVAGPHPAAAGTFSPAAWRARAGRPGGAAGSVRRLLRAEASPRTSCAGYGRRCGRPGPVCGSRAARRPARLDGREARLRPRLMPAGPEAAAGGRGVPRLDGAPDGRGARGWAAVAGRPGDAAGWRPGGSQARAAGRLPGTACVDVGAAGCAPGARWPPGPTSAVEAGGWLEAGQRGPQRVEAERAEVERVAGGTPSGRSRRPCGPWRRRGPAARSARRPCTTAPARASPGSG